MERVGVSKQFIVLEYLVASSGQFKLSMSLLNDRKISLYGAKKIEGGEDVYFNELQLLVESLIKETFENQKINIHRFNKATVVVDNRGGISLKVKDAKGIEKDLVITNNGLQKDIKGLVDSILGNATKAKETPKAEQKSVARPKQVISDKNLAHEKLYDKQRLIESLHLENAKANLTNRSSQKSDKGNSAKKDIAKKEKKERILRQLIKEEIVHKIIKDNSIKKKEKNRSYNM